MYLRTGLFCYTPLGVFITKCGVITNKHTLKRIHTAFTKAVSKENKLCGTLHGFSVLLMACFAGVLSALYIESHQDLDEE